MLPRPLSLCESPIEKMFLQALAAEIADFTWCDDGAWSETHRAVFAPQESVGKYRVDLAIADFAGRPLLVVELDGHSFHEKTKRQAQHDKSRDRALVAAGWVVLRFTGSEVYADARKCAREVIAILERR